METVCVGIDVGSSSCKIAVIETESRKHLHEATVATVATALVAQMQALRAYEVHVHLEASDMAEWVRYVIKPHVKRVIVSHPKMNAYIGRDPRKNDKIDARKLAELLAIGKYIAVYFHEDTRRGELKRIVQLYEQVVKCVSQRKVAIKTALRRVGVIEKGKELYSEEGRKPVLKRLEASPMASVSTVTAVQELYGLLDAAVKHRRRILQALKPLAAQFPEIGRFDAVAGVGLALACRFAAYVQDPTRFSNKRKLWQYAGLGVCERSSNDNPLGRKMLDPNSVHALKAMSRSAVLAALRCKAPNPIKMTYWMIVNNGGSETHARLTAQRKVVSMLRAMWIQGTEYKPMSPAM